MKYAKKLNLHLASLIDFNKKTRLIENHAKRDYGYALVRYYYPRKDVDLLLSSFPDKIRSSCLGVTKSVISDLSAHVHTIEQCVINIYHKTNGKKTVFFEGDQERIPSQYNDDNGYYQVDESKLTAVESFIAEDNDIWLLNSRQPHAVIEDPTQVRERYLIQIYLSIPFSEAADCFHKINIT